MNSFASLPPTAHGIGSAKPRLKHAHGNWAVKNKGIYILEYSLVHGHGKSIRNLQLLKEIQIGLCKYYLYKNDIQ